MSSTQLHMPSSYLMESGILDYDFGRCDGHHEMVDLRLRKKELGAGFVDSRYLSVGRSHTAAASSETTAGMSRPEVRGRLTPRFRTIAPFGDFTRLVKYMRFPTQTRESPHFR